MRSPAAFLLLAPTLVVLATACEDAHSPQEPLGPLEEAAGAAPPADAPAMLIDQERWADGYVWHHSTAATYTPDPTVSFNRAGEGIQITRRAGTVGRYLVQLTGLSGLLGTRNTVQVTGYGADDTYCAPVGAQLLRSQVEVQCFQTGTGAPVNAYFTALVLGKRANVAFAHAHRPSASDYAPQQKASWNPGGAIRVSRSGTGSYRVDFARLASIAQASGNSGHLQVSAVGTSANHCAIAGWTGTTDLGVYVQCYTRTGAPVDSKFNVLFLLPSIHLGYAYGAKPIATEYLAAPEHSTNPTGTGAWITRAGTGRYTIDWPGIDPHILDLGNVQVTAVGNVNAQCKVESWHATSASVRCFAPDGTLVDTYYTVLLGS